MYFNSLTVKHFH